MATSKMESWKVLISEWQGSGETHEVFCMRKGVTVATISYWRTKLKKLDVAQGIIENNNTLVRFSIPTPQRISNVIIEWPQGIRLPKIVSIVMKSMPYRESQCAFRNRDHEPDTAIFPFFLKF